MNDKVHTWGQFGRTNVGNRSGDLAPLLWSRIIRRDGRIFFVFRNRLPPSAGLWFGADTRGATRHGGGNSARRAGRSRFGRTSPQLGLPGFSFSLRPTTNTTSNASCVLVDLHGFLARGLRLVIFGVPFLYATRALTLSGAFAWNGEREWWSNWRRGGEPGSSVVAVSPETRDQLIVLWRRICSPSCSLDISLRSVQQVRKTGLDSKKCEFDLPCVCLRNTSRLEDPGHRPPQRSSHNIATVSHTRIHPPLRAPSSHPSQRVRRTCFRRHAQRYSSDRRSRPQHTPCGIAHNGALEVGVNPHRNPRQPRASREASDVPKWLMWTGWPPPGVWRGYTGGGSWRGRKRLGGRVFGIVALDWIEILNRSVRLVERESSAEATSGGISCL